MIRISWFNKETIDKYYEAMKEKISIINVVWWSKNDSEYSVNLKSLLSMEREQLFNNYPSLNLYIELCKIIKRQKNKSFLAETMKISDLKKNYPTFFSHYDMSMDEDSLIAEIKNDLENAMNGFKTVLNYEKQLTDAWRRELMIALNVDCCVYCNRLYITALQKNAKRIDDCSTASLDHFYNKDIFPLFSLSLFNFIPSCTVCNTILKGTRWLDIVYPYEEGFEQDALFTRNTSADSQETIQELFSNGPTPVNLKLEISPKTDSEKRKRIENSKKLFYLEEVYSKHTKYAGEIIWKKKIHDADYLNALQNSLPCIIGISEKTLNLFLYGYDFDNNEPYDANKPLSKLTYDLVRGTNI